MDTQESPLATFTMDELVDEIKSRHEAVLVVTHRQHKFDHNADVTGRWWSGGRIMALGLAESMRVYLGSVFVNPDNNDE